jgi:hypothetical protein
MERRPGLKGLILKSKREPLSFRYKIRIMRKLLTLSFFLFCGILMAQQNQNNEQPEFYVRRIIQEMTDAYQLDNDQQIAVKKAAVTILENARNNNLSTDNKKAFQNEFNARMQAILRADQYNHYLNVQSKTTSVHIDNMMERAKNSSTISK